MSEIVKTIKLCSGTRNGVSTFDPDDIFKPSDENINLIQIKLVPDIFSKPFIKITVELQPLTWDKYLTEMYQPDIYYSDVDYFVDTGTTRTIVRQHEDGLVFGLAEIVFPMPDACDFNLAVVSGSLSGDLFAWPKPVVSEGDVDAEETLAVWDLTMYIAPLPGESIWVSYFHYFGYAFMSKGTGYRAIGMTGGVIVEKKWYIEDFIMQYKVNYEGASSWFLNSQCIELNLNQWIFLSTGFASELVYDITASVDYQNSDIGTNEGDLNISDSFILPVNISGYGSPGIDLSGVKNYGNTLFFKGVLTSIDRLLHKANVYLDDIRFTLTGIEFYCGSPEILSPTSGEQFIVGDTVIVMVTGEFLSCKIIGLIPYTTCPIIGDFLVSNSTGTYLVSESSSNLAELPFNKKNYYGVLMAPANKYTQYGPILEQNRVPVVLNGVLHYVVFNIVGLEITITISNYRTGSYSVHKIIIPEDVLAQTTAATSLATRNDEIYVENLPDTACFTFNNIIIGLEPYSVVYGRPVKVQYYFSGDGSEITCLITSGGWSGGASGQMVTAHFWYIYEGTLDSACTRTMQTTVCTIKIKNIDEISVTFNPITLCTSTHKESIILELVNWPYQYVYGKFDWSLSGTFCIGGVYNGNTFEFFTGSFGSVDTSYTIESDLGIISISGGYYDVLYCSVNNVQIPISIITTPIFIDANYVQPGSYTSTSEAPLDISIGAFSNFNITSCTRDLQLCTELVTNVNDEAIVAFMGLGSYFNNVYSYAYCNKLFKTGSVAAGKFVTKYTTGEYYLIAEQTKSVLDTSNVSFSTIDWCIPIANKLFLR